MRSSISAYNYSILCAENQELMHIIFVLYALIRLIVQIIYFHENIDCDYNLLSGEGAVEEVVYCHPKRVQYTTLCISDIYSVTPI